MVILMQEKSVIILSKLFSFLAVKLAVLTYNGTLRKSAAGKPNVDYGAFSRCTFSCGLSQQATMNNSQTWELNGSESTVAIQVQLNTPLFKMR